MAPSAVEIEQQASVTDLANLKLKASSFKEPLKSTGSLDKYTSIDITPVIGTEYTQVNLVELINAPNADELLRDLAIKSTPVSISTCSQRTHSPLPVSQRGVVFFRAQSNLTNDIQKALIQRLGELAGKPVDSGLHIHPVLNSDRELGGSDPEISTISSVQFDKLYKKKLVDESRQSAKNQSTAQWHSDIAFEPAPADYTSLRLTQLPRTGGGESGHLDCSLDQTNMIYFRYPLGIWLRDLRPHLRALPEVPRDLDCHIRTTGFQRRRSKRRLPAVRKASWESPQCRLRAQGNPSSCEDKSCHWLAIHLPCGRSRQTHQWCD